MSGTALKIVRFFGAAPKISPELLPETVAQYAFNLDLSSGDLLPFRRSTPVAALDKPGTIRTIYPLTDPVTGALRWLHWAQDVDVARAQVENDTTQRIYFTGDGPPKVTNFAMATSGPQIPAQSFTLGLPMPSGVPSASVAAFTQRTSTHRSRDAGNTATITTSEAHGLTTGDVVTTTGFAGTGYNLTNVPVTVINPTQFSYFTFGAAEVNTADAGGRIDMAGPTIPRTYVFTYYTAWEEESVPSAPSAAVFLKEGQDVTVTGLPAAWPHGAGYQTAGMQVRIYRSVAGVTGTQYFRVGSVALGTTSFVDNIDITSLDADDLLESEDYDAPDPQMQGIMAIHNNMLVGFFGTTICFSEPGKPHAWPIRYYQQIDAPIVGLGAFGTLLLALTNQTPWVLTGNNPRAQSLARTDYILPCLSKRSIVNIGFGVVWSSPGGLAVYSTSIGADYLTKHVHSWTTWPHEVNPPALVGEYYRGAYFGSDGVNTFIFERSEQVGGHLVQTDVKFTATHYRSASDELYFVDVDVAGVTRVFLWNSPGMGPATLDWKSKVFTTKGFVNFGAARLIADYTTPVGELEIAQENQQIVVSNANWIAGGGAMGELGTLEANELSVAGSPLRPMREAEFTATFQLFVNKQLLFSTTRSSDDAFRLPTGYRADTFEIRVATTARVRAVHLSSSMTGLRNI